MNDAATAADIKLVNNVQTQKTGHTPKSLQEVMVATVITERALYSPVIVKNKKYVRHKILLLAYARSYIYHDNSM